MLNFKWRHFPKDIILMAVRWYLAYPLSYRNVEELMLERGIKVDHGTINRCDIDEDALADCIATYQALGCWTPHVEITPEAYEAALDVFEFLGTLEQRYAYEQVCCAPPVTY